MSIQRQDFLKAGVAISLVSVAPRSLRADAIFAPRQRFQLRTRLELKQHDGVSHAWVPVPSLDETDWFRSNGNEWSANTQSVQLVKDPKYGTKMLHLQWHNDQAVPTVEVVSTFATRDRAVDFGKPGGAALLSESERMYPQTETASRQLDCLGPGAFSYTITTKELAS